MTALNKVRRFSKERNLDNLARALNFLLAFRHILEICSSNVNSLSFLTPSSLTLLLSQILSLRNLPHTCPYFVPEAIKLHLSVFSFM